MIKKILLIGPSSDVTNFNKEYLLKHKEENYKLFCYADVLKFFVTHEVQPDYFSFIDPNTNLPLDVANEHVIIGQGQFLFSFIIV